MKRTGRQRKRLLWLVAIAMATMATGAPQGQGGWLSRQRVDPDFGKPKPAEAPAWAKDRGWGIDFGKIFPGGKRSVGVDERQLYLPALAFRPVLGRTQVNLGAFPEGRSVGTPWTMGEVEKAVLKEKEPHSLAGFLAHLETVRKAEAEAAKQAEREAKEGEETEGEESGGDREVAQTPEENRESGRNGGTGGVGEEEKAGEETREGVVANSGNGEPIFPRPQTRRLLDERILLYFPVDAGGEREVNVIIPGDYNPIFRPPSSGEMRSTATIRQEP